jgi:hypothetical protein
MSRPSIQGFLQKPKSTSTKAIYRGRFACQSVQWTGEGQDAFVTFTTSAGELTDAAESNLIWTDQDVQRGIQPGLVSKPARELSLGDGYPDSKSYIFDAEKADEIAEKLLVGTKLFLNPLVWNLRPGTFEAFWSEQSKEIFVYSGRIYLPDSHHRHQAIIKAVRLWRDNRDAYPAFSESRQFKVELYFLGKQDEGNYFFDKNQRPKPVAQSKAYDLTNQDDLSVLAKKVIDHSSSLAGNVNRVTDRLTAKNPQVVTLSTLREMMKTFAGTDSVEETELEGLAKAGARFYDMLAGVRPELGSLSLPDRNKARRELLADAAVMMHGYAALMRDFNETIARDGVAKASEHWQTSLKRLSPTTTYRWGRWSGDLFSRENPVWAKVGVLKPGKGGTLNPNNTSGTRAQCARVLRAVLKPGFDPSKLSQLGKEL